MSLLFFFVFFVLMFFFFFFSSRRRHTRWNCDWSSDVCSSDLDSNDRPGQKLGCEFHFADDRLAQRTRLFELRSVEWHTRADDDQVLSSEGADAVPAGFDCDPMVEQKQDFVAQLRLGLRVGNGDPRASGLEKQSRGYA